MKTYSTEELRERFSQLKFFWPQDHLIGVRNVVDASDRYDDQFFWVENGEVFRVYTGTTNPGSYYLQNFLNQLRDGTAIMATNQQMFEGFAKGFHKGRECWRQRKIMRIYRDADMDLASEESGLPYIGQFGIHIHAMFRSVKSERIYNWSAACQGMNNPVQWSEFITRSYMKCNHYLTYSLLREF